MQVEVGEGKEWCGRRGRNVNQGDRRVGGVFRLLGRLGWIPCSVKSGSRRGWDSGGRCSQTAVPERLRFAFFFSKNALQLQGIGVSFLIVAAAREGRQTKKESSERG